MRSSSLFSTSFVQNQKLSNMSMIGFLRDPFPDNHDGFDYSPKSYTDYQRDHAEEVRSKQNADQQNKMMSMFASIFK